MKLLPDENDGVFGLTVNAADLDEDDPRYNADGRKVTATCHFCTWEGAVPIPGHQSLSRRSPSKRGENGLDKALDVFAQPNGTNTFEVYMKYGGGPGYKGCRIGEPTPSKPFTFSVEGKACMVLSEEDDEPYNHSQASQTRDACPLPHAPPLPRTLHIALRH